MAEVDYWPRIYGRLLMYFCIKFRHSVVTPNVRWKIVAQWRLKPRAFRWPYKYSTTELPSHPVISPTTFHLKPTLVTIIKNLQCFLRIREMFWNSDSITGIYKSNPLYIIQISALIYLNSWKFNLSRIVKESSLNLLDRTIYKYWNGYHNKTCISD